MNEPNGAGIAGIFAANGPDTRLPATRHALATLLARRGRPDLAAVSSLLDLLERELAN